MYLNDEDEVEVLIVRRETPPPYAHAQEAGSVMNRYGLSCLREFIESLDAATVALAVDVVRKKYAKLNQSPQRRAKMRGKRAFGQTKVAFTSDLQK